MKRNLIVITTLIGFILLGIIFVQPTKSEAGNSITPMATPSPRKKQIVVRRTKSKRAGYTAGGTWVSGDSIGTFNKTRRKTTLRKKPKNTQNLLPYMEQSNLRKRKRNR